VELEKLKTRIAQEIEKRSSFERLTTDTTGSYTSIDHKADSLQKLTGAVMDDGDHAANKGSWKKRVKNGEQGAGIKSKYTPKSGDGGKGNDIERPQSRFPTPAVKSAATRPATPVEHLGDRPSASYITPTGRGDNAACCSPRHMR
jgi:hypothetical protein